MAHEENKITSDFKSSFLNEMRKQEDVKKILRNCWKKILEVEEIGFNDNFYELGGTSFNILQVQQAINIALEIDIKVIDLFTHPTIEDLAKYITDTKQEENKIAFKVNDLRVFNEKIKRTAQLIINLANSC